MFQAPVTALRAAWIEQGCDDKPALIALRFVVTPLFYP
jgi:hypothetical protein